MYRYFFASLLVCLIVTGCSEPADTTAEKQEPEESSVKGAVKSAVESPGKNLVAQVGIEGTPFGDFIIGEPVQYKNLTIFPISSKVAKNQDRFITLDEGLKSGKVKIFELGQGQDQEQNQDQPQAQGQGQNQDQGQGQGPDQAAPDQRQVQSQGRQVNRLMIHNTSDKPLYLMPGEVIVGGSQDRTIGEELVIKPGGKPMAIDVFCVEHGRWGKRSGAETVALLQSAVAQSQRQFIAQGASPGQGQSVALAGSSTDLAEVANRADKGEFVASIGQLSKGARIAVQDTKRGFITQTTVWNDVGGINAGVGNDSLTGNFALNYGGAQIVERLDPYIEKLQKPVAERKQVVGVAVAVNGKVESVDIFESTPLFLKFWPKLMKSYALDAVAVAGKKDALLACPTEKCKKFLEEVQNSEVEEVKVEGDLAQTRKRSKGIIVFQVRLKKEGEDAAEAVGGIGGGLGGSFGGGVHGAGFSQ